jgi:hypothetical protein
VWLNVMIQVVLYILHGFDLVLHTVRNYSLLLLDQISLKILIEFFTRKIKKWDINNCYSITFFLHTLDLVLHIVIEYPLPLD